PLPRHLHPFPTRRSSDLPSHSRSQLAMSQQFDICKMESDGSLRLIEGAGDVERARARVKKLAAFSPGEYIIANRQTGERISIKSDRKSTRLNSSHDQISY